MEASAAAPRWSVFTHHGHVLLYLAANSDARVRDIAEAVGVTQRTAQVMLRDLRDAGYVTSTSEGRRNHYRIAGSARLHHPGEAGLTVGAVVELATRHLPALESDQRRLVF